MNRPEVISPTAVYLNVLSVNRPDFKRSTTKRVENGKIRSINTIKKESLGLIWI